MSQSVWTDHIKLPDFHKLEGKKKTDVLIIGGGLSGILCAYFLELAGVDYILVEGKRIGSGITKNTTAKITSQHGLIYDKMIRSKGKEHAQNVNGMYVDEAKQGFSFRNYDNLLLLGGGRHRTGKQGGNYDELRAFIQTLSSFRLRIKMESN